jgi:multiple sugar transport system substrate-binding protein
MGMAVHGHARRAGDTRRALVGTAGAAGALGLLAACVPGGGPVGPGAAPSRKDVTLQTLDPPISEQNAELLNRVFRGFEEQNPGAKVVNDEARFNLDRLSEKLTTLLAGGSAPDVTFVHPGWSAAAFAKGWFLDITARARADRPLRMDDLFPHTLDFCRWGDKLYALPTSTAPSMMYFNRTLFDRYGVKTPDKYEREGRWTWDALLEVARQLTRRDATPPTYGYVGASQAMQFYLSSPIWSWGGEVTSRDEREALLHEAAAVNAIEFQVDLIKTHRVVPVGAENTAVPNPGGRKLNSGQIAVEWGHRGYLPDITAHAQFEVGVAPVPKGPRTRAARDGLAARGVLQDARSPDEGYALCAHMSQWEGHGRLQLESGAGVPIRRSPFEDGSFKKLLLPWEAAYQDFYFETPKFTRVWRLPKAGLEFQNRFNEAWGPMTNGQIAVKAAMDDLRPRLNEFLRQAAT